MESQCRAVVAGAGIGGLTAALVLARRGWQVSVCEQAATFGEVGAGLQLGPNASRLLVRLGVGEALRERAVIPQAAEFRAHDDGRVLARLELGDAARRRFGADYLQVHRADLHEVLLSALRGHDRVELLGGCGVTGFRHAGAAVRVCTDGGELEAGLLVGADGIRSLVRERLFGPSAARWTGNVAWRALLPVARLAVAPPPRTVVWWGPGAHVVQYLVRGGELVNLVCVREVAAPPSRDCESWTGAVSATEVRGAFAGWHPQVQGLLQALRDEDCLAWGLYDRKPLRRWGCGRVTLLGDACHPALPFLAQGAAMAIEDAVVLGRCLEQEPVPVALQRYARSRRSRTAWVQAMSRRNARVYHLRGWPARLRNLAAGVAASRIAGRLYGHDAGC